MTKRGWLFACVAIFSLLIAYTLLSEWFIDECGLSEQQAKNIVLKELVRLHLDEKYLSAAVPYTGSCTYSYYYEKQEVKLNYIVLSSWLNGVRLIR